MTKFIFGLTGFFTSSPRQQRQGSMVHPVYLKKCRKQRRVKRNKIQTLLGLSADSHCRQEKGQSKERNSLVVHGGILLIVCVYFKLCSMFQLCSVMGCDLVIKIPLKIISVSGCCVGNRNESVPRLNYCRVVEIGRMEEALLLMPFL